MKKLHYLSLDKRIQRVRDLSRRIASEASKTVLSSTEIAELDRRLDDFEENGVLGTEWNELKARARSLLR